MVLELVHVEAHISSVFPHLPVDVMRDRIYISMCPGICLAVRVISYLSRIKINFLIMIMIAIFTRLFIEDKNCPHVVSVKVNVRVS